MADELMRGWTPKTDHLLLDPTASVDGSSESDDGSRGHGGYDVIDHAFGSSFPSNLLEELRNYGWIGDGGPGSSGGRLRPARTKMDARMDGLLAGFATPGNGDGEAVNGTNGGSRATRGDESAFIPRKERMQESFPRKYPHLHRFVSSIESTACQRLGLGGGGSDFATPHFEFDRSLTSVQVARYPGDGTSGYPRHCDRGARCLREPTIDTINKKGDAERVLTFVYYLTPSDWDADLDGGALRMFSPNTNRDAAKEDGNSSDDTRDQYFDLVPYSDRLVVFRSDMVEHQVLPSLRRDRIAITVWLYGRVVHPGSRKGSNAILPQNDVGSNNDVIIFNGNGQRNGSSLSQLPPPLPLPPDDLTCKSDYGKESIYVAIPAYRDPETWPTIKSLVETAGNPERVFVGVVFQVDTSSREEVDRLTTLEGSGVRIECPGWSVETNSRCIVMDCRHATGPCYARHLAQTLHRGEDYVLQIDSHMRFRPNWDEYLIRQLKRTENPERALLTTYPPGYELPDGPGPDAETRATVLVPWKFGSDGILRQKGRLIRPGYQLRRNNAGDDESNDRNDNLPCLLYAGGFNFSRSSLLEVCPYDRKLHGLFFGEEISMAARLYTHGVDLYAPPETVCYHLWRRNPLRSKDDTNEEMMKRREESLEVVRMQLRGTGGGLGTVRSVEQFATELGVDFERQTLVPGCENAGLGNGAFVSPMLLDSAEEEKKESSDALAGEDLSSVLKLVGQFM